MNPFVWLQVLVGLDNWIGSRSKPRTDEERAQEAALEKEREKNWKKQRDWTYWALQTMIWTVASCIVLYVAFVIYTINTQPLGASSEMIP